MTRLLLLHCVRLNPHSHRDSSIQLAFGFHPSTAQRWFWRRLLLNTWGVHVSTLFRLDYSCTKRKTNHTSFSILILARLSEKLFENSGGVSKPTEHESNHSEGDQRLAGRTDTKSASALGVS